MEKPPKNCLLFTNFCSFSLHKRKKRNNWKYLVYRRAFYRFKAIFFIETTQTQITEKQTRRRERMQTKRRRKKRAYWFNLLIVLMYFLLAFLFTNIFVVEFGTSFLKYFWINFSLKCVYSKQIYQYVLIKLAYIHFSLSFLHSPFISLWNAEISIKRVKKRKYEIPILMVIRKRCVRVYLWAKL